MVTRFPLSALAILAHSLCHTTFVPTFHAVGWMYLTIQEKQNIGNLNNLLHYDIDVLKFPSLGGTYYMILGVNPSVSKLIISTLYIENSPFNISTQNNGEFGKVT